MPNLNILNKEDDLITESKPPCQICQKQFSHYVCPRCNLKYCSLACYKDLEHAECTESFYRDSVTAEINSRSDKDESKQKMLQLLQRFEAENTSNHDNLEEEEEEEEEDLAQRLRNLNVETADPDILWDKLSSEERQEFEMMLKQLEMEEDMAWSSLGLKPYEPWWEINPSLVQEVGLDNDNDIPNLPNFNRLVGQGKAPNPVIQWTMLHIGMTYCYLMRHCMGDLTEGDVFDTLDILKHLSRSVLFSTDPPTFGREMDVVVDLVDQIMSLDPNNKDPKRRSQLMILCLKDGLRLLESNYMVRALHALWEFLNNLEQKRRVSLAVRKVYFHIAAADYIITLDSQSGRIDLLKQVLLTAQEKIRSDDMAFEQEYNAAIEARKRNSSCPKIVQL
ncbi:hypothetical protein CLU79DRAFT_774819 [Phycomyces nitens]|nr:hypothetical protein CLU79DRAFT_774819 [Phycomyces nitens]